jgi:hypothetical protein
MFFGGELPPFCKHKKKPLTSVNKILIRIYINDIILHWVLGLVTKI